MLVSLTGFIWPKIKDLDYNRPIGNYFIILGLMLKIELVKGDITNLLVDAIVNAANNSLLGGSGVDGAIHRAAGPELLAECRTIGGCTTGGAKITKGYKLPAKYVIHAVGPVWRGGENDERMKLKSAYENSLLLAIDNNVKSIAFPNISTGIYNFPKREAAEIAINTVREVLDKNNYSIEVTFVCFDQENYDHYLNLLSDLR
jgi:O-acetyl-ADP-ribose deacetylase (regulator of RNase III)